MNQKIEDYEDSLESSNEENFTLGFGDRLNFAGDFILDINDTLDDITISESLIIRNTSAALSIFAGVGCLVCAYTLTKDSTCLGIAGTALLGLETVCLIDTTSTANKDYKQAKRRKLIRQIFKNNEEN